MNITILNYTGKQTNWGCQVTSRNLIELLYKRYGSNLHLQFIDIGFSGNLLGKLVNRLRFIFPTTNQKSICFQLFTLLAWLEGNNMSKIKGCDILVLNGEGSLHGYNSQLIKFFYYLSYAKSLKKKVCIINHSLQFDNPSAERYLRLLYRLSDLNFFREIISIENAGLKNCANSFIVPDAAFSNYYLDTDSVDFTTLMPTKYILASGSVILNSGNKGYFELLKKLEEYYQIPVVFIASCSADKKLESIIRVNYKWRYFDNNDLSVEQVQKLIKGAQFFYSGRFHLNILSAISSKIFIPFISNTIKMEGLLSLLSYPFKAIDFNNFEIDIVFCSIIELISRKQQIEWELGQRCKQLVEDLEFNYQRNMVI